MVVVCKPSLSLSILLVTEYPSTSVLIFITASQITTTVKLYNHYLNFSVGQELRHGSEVFFILTWLQSR